MVRGLRGSSELSATVCSLLRSQGLHLFHLFVWFTPASKKQLWVICSSCKGVNTVYANSGKMTVIVDSISSCCFKVFAEEFLGCFDLPALVSTDQFWVWKEEGWGCRGLCELWTLWAPPTYWFCSLLSPWFWALRKILSMRLKSAKGSFLAAVLISFRGVVP